jgi:hypothetical protein
LSLLDWFGKYVTGPSSLSPSARKFWVPSEKELKDGHKGNLSRSRFINAKQRKSAPSRQLGEQAYEGQLCRRS